MDREVILTEVPSPMRDSTGIPVTLSDETMRQRKENVLSRMEEMNLDALVIYADVEHGSNFEYLTGFIPRFEEALLVLHRDGTAVLVLGNENLNKSQHSRIRASAVHAPYFSLPDQPMENDKPLTDLLRETGIAGKQIGLVGWKKFRSRFEDSRKLFDVPHYITDALFQLCGKDNVINAADLFIGPHGVRVTNNPNEIAHYEFGASLSGDAVMDAMDALKPGVRETEIGEYLLQCGQTPNVVPIAAFGRRFEHANLYPGAKRLKLGDPVSLTVGYKGGLTSRAGYAVQNEDELPDGLRDYAEKVAVPYFRALCVWLETIHAGMTGGELYSCVERVLPKADFHWYLCPGHLTADEEWLASPVYEGSEEILQSGSLFQTDIIPSVPGYGGVSAESPCCLADAALRQAIAEQEPELYQRMMERRAYMKAVLGIRVNDDVLPMSSSLGYLRPYLFGRQALVQREKTTVPGETV